MPGPRSEPERAPTDRAAREHFVGDLGLRQYLASETRCLVLAPFGEQTRSATGHFSLGVLATMFDVGASAPALIAGRPDWTATQDLSVYGAEPIVDGPVLVDCRLLRAGKKAVLVGADIYDTHGESDLHALATAAASGDGLTLAGAGVVTFARIPRAAATDEDSVGYDPARWVGDTWDMSGASPPTAPLLERMGLEYVDRAGGRLSLARVPYLSNSIGTIQGGAQAVLIEAAAEAMRPGAVAADIQIRFLSQVKIGPTRTVGRAIRDAADHSVVEITVLDAGNEDQMLALGTATLRTESRAEGAA